MTIPTTPTPTTPATPSVQPSPSGLAATQSTTFLERLANQMGVRAGAASIVGSPIERDGVTVVPVARASWGFGGGGGGQGENQGSGGGGGASVRPVGYIELKNGQAIFRPIYDPSTVLRVAATFATAFAIAMLLRLTARFVRGR